MHRHTRISYQSGNQKELHFLQQLVSTESAMTFFDLWENEYPVKKQPPIVSIMLTRLASVLFRVNCHMMLEGRKREIGALTAAEKASLVTIIACMSTGGGLCAFHDHLPPHQLDETG